MPQAPTPTVENSFLGGLKTEFTGLNFPENSCTDVDNVTFSLIGDVTRREGIDYETNFHQVTIDRTLKAISTYKWNNVGGDGSTQIVVEQIGSILYFYRSSSATQASPLSNQALVSTIDVSTYLAAGSVNTVSNIECQYTDGNGYLFVFHPSCDPFYCTYNAGTITANIIVVQSRDFIGISETGVPDSYRPLTLSAEHHYNLYNQGWFNTPSWSTTSTTSTRIITGTTVFTVASGLVITNGDTVTVTAIGQINSFESGTVTSYSGTNLTLSITSVSYGTLGGFSAWNNWAISHSSDSLITTWLAAENNYPSNADVWWLYKNSSGVYSPATTATNVTLNNSPAAKGHFILSSFIQQRSTISGFAGLTDVITYARPRTGTWFQGRVWYAGVDGSFQASGDAPYSTWTENLYFTQVVTTVSDFNKCYQTNDPTAEDLFDLLPTDGGVVTIQGSGSIYKLFPVQTGLLVFAANGIWFISGSQGVGFSATDYTVTKVSGVQSISSTSFINVLGWPIFWNEEGIYEVVPQGASDTQNNRRNFFSVNNLCLGTILSFYNDIPMQSKKYVKGDYHPIDYVIQWCYRSTNETDVTSRYQFDTILNYNTASKAFYPWSISNSATLPWIHSINYVAGPGGSTSPAPAFKYLTSVINGATYNFTFSEELDSSFQDWNSTGSPVSYTSFFISGYNLKGKAITKFQTPYTYMFSRNPADNAYGIQSLWDYAGTGTSGRWSSRQIITNSDSNYTMLYRRHRLRGRGLAVQLKVTSVTGQPFDLMGWSMWNVVNQGI